MFLRTKLNHPFFEGDDGKGPKGEPKPVDIKTQIAEAVAEATAGLTKNRDEILGEKREQKALLDTALTQIQNLGGTEGVQALLEFKQRLEKDEIGTLLAEGKHEEWFDARVGSLRGEHGQVVEGLEAKVVALETERDAAQANFIGVQLKTTIQSACAEAGILATAVKDVTRQAKEEFSFDQERGLVIKDPSTDAVVLGKDAKTPKTVAEWLDEQKEASRHWWPPSKGAGARGAHGQPGGSDVSLARLGEGSYGEYVAARKELGLKDGLDSQIPG